MIPNPYISQQMVDEHRRDLLADAQRQSLARPFSAEPRSAQSLIQRLSRRLRAIARPRPAAVA